MGWWEFDEREAGLGWRAQVATETNTLQMKNCKKTTAADTKESAKKLQRAALTLVL